MRQTSGGAAYCHQVAQRTPAPAPAEERAAARQRERVEQERRRCKENDRSRREQEARYWGGRAPDSDCLRDIAPRAVGLARIDRDLVDEIAAAGPVSQRAMAAWAARETCRRAGMAELDRVAEALDARQDNPLEAAVDTVKTAAEVIPAEQATVIAAFRAEFALPQLGLSWSGEHHHQPRTLVGIGQSHALLHRWRVKAGRPRQERRRTCQTINEMAASRTSVAIPVKPAR